MAIIPITDLDIEELKPYTKLREKELLRFNEPGIGLFICESPKVIIRALDDGYTPMSVLMDEDIDKEHDELLQHLPDIPVYTASYDLLTTLTGYHLTRGAMCLMKRKEKKSLEELLKNATRVGVLDNVENPTNVGAIIRSGAAMNLDAIILTHGCADPLYRRAARVSMGTVFQIDWTIEEENLYEKLNSLGFKTVALALKEDSISIEDEDLNNEDKLAIVLGNEGDGLDDETISKCDYRAIIPMKAGIDSLNVAAASAVAFYQLRKKA